MTSDYEALWQVVGNPDDRERFTTAPRGQTEQLNFRVFTTHSRMLDEIIHSGIDPRLKTKSDCLQDAVALFIDDWAKNYADGVSGRTLRQLHLEQVQTERQSQEEFLLSLEREIDAAKKRGDRDAMVKIRSYLQSERDDYMPYAPKSYIQTLDGYIENLDQMLQKEIPK